MEGLKNKYQNMSLRRSFILTVLITFGIVVLLSSLVIWGCSAFRKWLLPDSDTVYLTVQATNSEGDIQKYTARLRLEKKELTPLTTLYAIEGEEEFVPPELDPLSVVANVEIIENSYTMLTPKRKLAYQGCGIIMIAFPVLLSISGILFCGFYFYRRKLYFPLKALSEATEKIAEKNLDFKVAYASEDELGKLCGSFEEMRQALDANNRELWKMIEERKLIQASVAHDLRNPIAIIEGYTEYLQLHLHTDDFTTDRIEEIAGNIGKAAMRLEQYTESVRAVNRLDDMEIHRKQVPVNELIADITEDLSLMASEAGKTLRVTGAIPSGMISIDPSVLYRVLENILNNALRYAKDNIDLSFALPNNGCHASQDILMFNNECHASQDILMFNKNLVISLGDDGDGFSEEILKSRNRLLIPAANEDGHCGMGLTISRLLCQKHGGRLELGNRQPHGAEVKIIFEV